MNQTDRTTHELNLAIAKAVQSVITHGSISLVRNMDGDERVMFIEEDRAWLVTVEPLDFR
jgi:hypothetical protein